MATEFEDQQRVLSEVSHDLANRFHRSYYFLDLLVDAIGEDHNDAATLLERLREAVTDIESMARGTLELVRPVELHRLRVRVDDLVASLKQHAGLRGVEVVGDATPGRCEVEVDPARISEALAALCGAVMDGEEAAAPLRVELVGGNPVGMRVFREAAVPESKLDLRLALGARIAKLHGGALDIEQTGAGSLALWLPVAGKES